MYKQKIVSQLGPDGYLVGPTVADESPLEPGVFLTPGGAIDRPPPDRMESGKAYRPAEDGDGWIEEEDHRQETLYRISDGAVYQFGAQQGDEAYNGVGLIPAWLTASPRPDAWSVWKDGAWERDETAWQAQVQARGRAEQERRLAQAGQRISLLQDAVDLDMATEADKAALLAWRRYRVEVSRVDLNQEAPSWPDEP
ncbi:tail fiber assembly protein [Achromobacter insuavis]|uniref:tail fiber assembly protein n=1 Tax=Achromobacter insuavis TaxID=1287735 RepID=UPI001F147AE4|nr:tail fiber assembly protein [Achromobacter insuavis]